MQGINVSRHLIVRTWSQRNISKIQIGVEHKMMLEKY